MTEVDWRVRLKNKMLKIEKLRDATLHRFLKEKNNYISYCNSNYNYVERQRLIDKKIDEINLNQNHILQMMNIRHIKSIFWFMHCNLLKIYSFKKKVQQLINITFKRRNLILEEINSLNLEDEIYSREDKIYIKNAENVLKRFGKFKKFNFNDYGINIKMTLSRVFNRDIAYQISLFI